MANPITLHADNAFPFVAECESRNRSSDCILYFYERPPLEMSTLDTRGSFPGYCEEGALVAGLFDSFRARVTFPPVSDGQPALTAGTMANSRERIEPPEGIRQRGVQFEMHWKKRGSSP